MNGTDRNLTLYKEEMKKLFDTYEIKKKYFDNILIRENWTALHYRYTRENKTDTKEDIYVGDRMQFLKFEKKDDGLKIVNSWIQ